MSQAETESPSQTVTLDGPCAYWDSVILNKTNLESNSRLSYHLTLISNAKRRRVVLL